MSHSRTQLFIDGQWVDPVRGGKFETINPATGEVITEVSNGSAEDIDIAVRAARACLNGDNWGYKSTGEQRAQLLRRLGEIVTERKEELARLDSLDMGKPLREALADIGDVITACEHFASIAEEQDAKQGEVVDNGTGGDIVTKIFLEPIGVIGGITPWNYPILMGVWKVLPALAAGCTIVLKPSELAPLSCLRLAEMCTEAGFPRGAVNCVTGHGADAGAPLSEVHSTHQQSPQLLPIRK
jgi:betaine-aldehyde dehydrogenase